MRGPGGHQRRYVKLRRHPTTRLCPSSVVLRWDQGEVSISGVLRGLRTKFRRRGCVWGRAPHSFLTGCWKTGSRRGKAEVWGHVIVRAVSLSHCSPSRVGRDAKESKQGLLTHPYGGGWTDILSPASTKHRRNISRVKISILVPLWTWWSYTYNLIDLKWNISPWKRIAPLDTTSL